MSKKQLRVLWMGIVLFVLMGFFPPEAQYFRGERCAVEYEFILTAPNIAFGVLLVQWAIAAAVTGGLIYTLKVEPELLLKIRCRILAWLFAKQPYEELLRTEREKRSPSQGGKPPESSDR